MNDAQIPFSTRLWLAFACLFRVLFDGAYAAALFRVHAALGHGPTTSTSPEVPAPTEALGPDPLARPDDAVLERSRVQGALQVLALFQREGRLVDFLEQDVAPFKDAEVGAAARVVHEGCRKALRAHAALTAVRVEDEGARVTLGEEAFARADVKLTGDVRGAAPYTGTLRHRGWRATSFTLPTPTSGHDANVLAPAELEL